MKKIIQFEEEEFNQKFMEFCERFIDQTRDSWGVRLISNEEKKVIYDPDTIRGSLMLIWNKTFKVVK
jgi:hypothetical protein